MKRVFAIFLALILMMSFVATTAVADATREKVTNKIGVTLQANADAPLNTASNHTYKAVKILDLYRMKDGSAYLSDSSGNPVYQYGIALSDTAGFISALTSAGFTYDGTTGAIQKGGANIASDTSNSATGSDATRLATTIAQYVQSTGIAGTPVSVGASTQLECGYWVIYEASNNNNDSEVATKPILVNILPTQTSGITLALKDAKVTLDKSLSVDGAGENVAAGQASVISYTIATNFPTYGILPSTRTVSFVITDTMPAGLDLDESSVKVAVGSTANVAAGSGTYTKSFANNVLTINFVSAYIINNPGAAVTVTYTAKPNTNAVYNNAAGNPNTASVTFANNPVVSSETDTLNDDAKVYLYAVALNKLDGAGSALANAKFKMHANTANGAVVEFVQGAAGKYYAKLGYNEVAGTISGTTVSEITIPATGVEFYGLPAGDYYLEETESPATYTKLANPVHIKIEEVSANGVLTGACKITVENGIVDTASTGTTGSGSANSATNGSLLHVKVQNYKGVTLPATGSTLSLILMVVGGVVVLGGIIAFIFIAMKKKNDDEEEAKA